MARNMETPEPVGRGTALRAGQVPQERLWGRGPTLLFCLKGPWRAPRVSPPSSTASRACWGCSATWSVPSCCACRTSPWPPPAWGLGQQSRSWQVGTAVQGGVSGVERPLSSLRVIPVGQWCRNGGCVHRGCSWGWLLLPPWPLGRLFRVPLSAGSKLSLGPAHHTEPRRSGATQKFPSKVGRGAGRTHRTCRGVDLPAAPVFLCLASPLNPS